MFSAQALFSPDVVYDDFAVRLPAFKTQLLSPLAVRPWGHQLMSLSLSLPICEVVTVLDLRPRCCADEME